MKWDSATYQVTDPGRYPKTAMIIGIVGAVACIIGVFVDRRQFYFSWLTAYVYWLTLGLGGLFFTMLHHLTGATWSVVLRRLSESIMSVVPYIIIAFLPIIFGIPDLYHWSHADIVAHDELLQGKAAFLNVPFFVIRLLIYFAVWTFLTYLLRKASFMQDKGHTPELKSRFVRISAPGMIAFAVTMTFASFDWMMSLDAHWYSTIFGVYIFSGSTVAVLAFMLLTAIYLHRRGILTETISVEHYHDLGKLLFAFLIFWAYMAFSQYLLIWYGNIPEETVWYLHRWAGTWKGTSLFLVFGHFIIPFFILITRGAKRNLTMLKIFALGMLIMHYVDLHWIIMPTLHPHGIHPSWMDLAAMMAVGGAFTSRFWRAFTARPLVPVSDPRLENSINFTNH